MDWTGHQQNTIVGGRRLSYLDVGEGQDAVLMLHGLAGSWHWWMDNLATLSESHRVIAVDLPGFGDSEAAVSQDIDSVVDGLLTLCDQLELGAVDVVGHSLGTLLACELADRAPDRIHRLILTGGPILSLIRLYSSPFSTLRQRPVVANFLIEALTAGIPIPARIQRAIANHAFLRWLALSPYVAHPTSLRPAVAAAMLAGAGAPGVIPTLRTGFRYPGERVLRSISHPTLVIAGSKDRIAPAQDLDEFASQEAVRRVVVLDDCGHCPMLEHPDAFNRELLEFLNPSV
ncbi:MAG: alpha/beta hydrolase [Thermoleophilaceae bacterium]|nr:alpha/beta hydrolase [Thermoleophilaceae bacterium]